MDAVDLPLNVPNTRFIVLRNNGYSQHPSVIICDYEWWCINEEEIVAWMNNNLASGTKGQMGSIIEFADREELALFLLTWQGPHV